MRVLERVYVVGFDGGMHLYLGENVVREKE